MRIHSLFSVAALFVANASVSFADPIDALIGEWVSPDGFAKQSFERQFDGAWLTTRMWFRSEHGWKLVAYGSIYRKPQVEDWFSVSRTADMDGIELYESRLRAAGSDGFELESVAIKGDGTIIETSEEWRFVDPNQYVYTIYKLEGAARTPWMEGSWVRREEDQ